MTSVEMQELGEPRRIIEIPVPADVPARPPREQPVKPAPEPVPV
jgi:hypothetical protein